MVASQRGSNNFGDMLMLTNRRDLIRREIHTGQCSLPETSSDLSVLSYRRALGLTRSFYRLAQAGPSFCECVSGNARAC